MTELPLPSASFSISLTLWQPHIITVASLALLQLHSDQEGSYPPCPAYDNHQPSLRSHRQLHCCPGKGWGGGGVGVHAVGGAGRRRRDEGDSEGRKNQWVLVLAEPAGAGPHGAIPPVLPHTS